MSPSEPSPSGIAFNPAQKQRWSLYAGFAHAADNDAAHGEIRGWVWLAMLSLGIAGIFALLLAISRVPGADEAFPWPVKFFEKGLIIHVILSFVVWFLSVFGAMSAMVTYRLSEGWPRWRGLGSASIIGSMAGTVLLFVPAWLNRGQPSLNNYLPVIIDPIYYAGLLVLGLSILLSVIRLFVNLIGRRGPLEPVTLSVLAAALIYVLALACFILAGLEIIKGNDFSTFNEDLFWGGGHVLQYLNTGLLLSAWYVLGGLSLGQPLVHPRLMAGALLVLILPVLVAPFFYVLYPAFSAGQTSAFTNLQYLLAPPTLLVAVGGALGVWGLLEKADPVPWRDVSFQCLLASMLVFGIGGVLGFYVDGADTRTPAHYHGVIGGINIAFMGLFYGLFLPVLERGLKPGKAVAASVWLYAFGQVFHSIGLFWAGGYGAPRKVAGAEQGIEALAPTVGLYLMGIGAVIAVIGGVMFIFMVTRALLKKG